MCPIWYLLGRSYCSWMIQDGLNPHVWNLGTSCQLGHLDPLLCGLSPWDPSSLDSLGQTSKGANTEATRPPKASAWNSQSVASATFCWSKQVTRPARLKR